MGRTEVSVSSSMSRTHAALLEDLHQLEEVARPGTDAGAEELRSCLTATLAHVTEHFKIEEEGGYLDVVRAHEPRLERAIQSLAEEHRELTDSLVSLIDAANSAEGSVDGYEEGVQGWIERLRRHEARESEVIQDAFNLDIGDAD